MPGCLTFLHCMMLCFGGGEALAKPDVVQFHSSRYVRVDDVTAVQDGAIATITFMDNLSLKEAVWRASGRATLVLKVDLNGVPQWSSVATHTHHLKVVSKGGHTFVAGQWKKAGNVAGCPLKERGHMGAFLARLDGKGQCVRLIQLAGTGSVTFSEVSTDGSTGVVVAGNASADFKVGPHPVDVVSKRSFFVSRFSVTGEHQWTKTGAGGNTGLTGMWLWAAQMGEDGRVVLGGDLSGAGSFMGQELQSGSEVFKEGKIPKAASFAGVLDPDGKLEWVRVVGTGTMLEQVAFDSENGIFLAGHFPDATPKVDFGRTFSWHSAKSSTGTIPRIFLARMKASGATDWVRTLHGDVSARSEGVAVDGAHIVVLAESDGPVTVGARSFGEDSEPRGNLWIVRWSHEGMQPQIHSHIEGMKMNAGAVDIASGWMVWGGSWQDATTGEPNTTRRMGAIWMEQR